VIAQARLSYHYEANLDVLVRMGNYRLGSDELVVDKEEHSQILMEDFAVVLIDEAEQLKHHRTRFTVAY
jgi:putative NADH-flavin reductase